MGDKEFNGDIEFNGDMEEGVKFWWEDYDRDIEEESREIIKRVSKIEDYDKGEEVYEQLLNALEYNEYFAHNRHLICESYLLSLRLHIGLHEDEDIDELIDRIQSYTNMKRTPCPYKQNILIINGNRKFTFLNTSKLDTGDKDDWRKILEKGKMKLRREYSYLWGEGDDDEKKFTVVCVKLSKFWWEDKDKDDDNEFMIACKKIKKRYT